VTIKVGRLGAESSGNHPKIARALPFSKVQAGLLAHPSYRPPAPFFDARPAGMKWRMLGNDKFGCCTIAAIVRQMMRNAYARGKPLSVRDSDVVNAYLKMNNGKDTGAMLLTALDFMKHEGIVLADGTHLKVLVYARVATRDRVQSHSAMQSFKGLYVAAGLPLALDDDRDERLELKPSAERTHRDAVRSMGGHAYNAFGHDRDGDKVVLWEDDMLETPAWTSHHREEAWVFADNQETDQVLLDVMFEQLAALKADLGTPA